MNKNKVSKCFNTKVIVIKNIWALTWGHYSKYPATLDWRAITSGKGLFVSSKSPNPVFVMRGAEISLGALIVPLCQIHNAQTKTKRLLKYLYFRDTFGEGRRGLSHL